MGIGGGLLSSTVKPSGPSGNVDIGASGVTFDFGMGGTPVDGFVIGGRLLGIVAGDPKVKAGGVERGTSGMSSLSMFQLFTDIYPMPDDGFHILAGVGPASYEYTHLSSSSAPTSMSGVGFTIGAGWEAWVGQQWSIGGLISLNWASVQSDYIDLQRPAPTGSDFELVYAGEAKATVFSPTLTLTATFH